MDSQFYDKVAKKFGSYHTDSSCISEYPEKDPEKVFKEKLLSLSDKNKNALDLGCADGRFTLSLAPHFKEIIAIDISEGMLSAAEKFQKKSKITNVFLKKVDADATGFADESFDVVWSRRGPTPYKEIYRLLKKGGNYIEIDIGEKDCQGIKEVFGKGQNYGDWKKESYLTKIKNEAQNVGFEAFYMKDFIYSEYYASYNDLDLFLQGVPIFEDFDSKKDKKLLETYERKFKKDKGILLERHRIVSIFGKIN